MRAARRSPRPAAWAAAVSALSALTALAALWALGGSSCGPVPPPPSRPPPKTPLEEHQPPRLIDDFEATPLAWTAVAADGVRAEVAPARAPAGQGLRLTFDFSGTSGYAVARRELGARERLDLSGNFELTFELRGQAPVNNFELKLIDQSGDNVWWYHRRDQALTAPWHRVVVKKRQIEFAWGPIADKTLREIAAIEIVISSGKGGGKGWIELDDLRLRPRASYDGPPPPPLVTATTATSGHGAGEAMDGKLDTTWEVGPRSGAGELTIDLQRERDLAGVLLHWSERYASAYQLDHSLDGYRWTPAASVAGGNGGLDPLMMLDTTVRFLRLRVPAEAAAAAGPAGAASGATSSTGQPGGFALAELELLEATKIETPNEFITAVAERLPRGALPRGFSGEQPYWTLVGVDGGRDSGLLSEDGALELRSGGPSVEPFLVVGGETFSWANARASQALVDGYLPIPQVTWQHGSWELEITALGAGSLHGAELAVRYVVQNRGAVPLVAQLVLAVRPSQVNPPAQFLNIVGGVAPIADVAWAPVDGSLLLDGRPALRPLTPPDRVALLPFHAAFSPGHSVLPASSANGSSLRDRWQLGTATLTYDLRVAPGQRAELVFTAPLIDGLLPSARNATSSGDGPPGAPPVPPSPLPVEIKADAKAAEAAATWFPTALAIMRQLWHEKLDRVALEVPPVAQPFVDTLRSSLAYMLLSRDGAMLRPGTRSYARAWIRDGAMISEALLRLGHPAIAADFLRFYAPYQYASGKVPCCVDAHGAGPVPENDSHGQLMYLARLVYRYGKDRALAKEVWPNVLAAARYQEQLRQSERTSENRTDGRRMLFGLMPPSISHEGYSAKPAYSYWDDFWALRGVEDAAALAGELGDAASATRLAAERDQFTAELRASILASAAAHRIPFIPGAAELGDFDATSTTIAVAPGVSPRALPAELLAATFERYWDEHEARRDGKKAWVDYTPYELRTPGTFIRLGDRERALELFSFFFADRRPAGWNQWAEVVGKQPRQVRFIGDMPHAWVHSDYARSALDLFAYERPADQAMVLGAGLTPPWLADGGVALGKLPTPWGQLSYSMALTKDGLELDLRATAVPPGGFVISWPFRPGGAARPGAVKVLAGPRRAPVWQPVKSLLPAAAGARELVVRARATKLLIPITVSPLPASAPPASSADSP